MFSCTHHPSSQPVANWQNLDLEQDGVFGISMEKAYQQLLKDKKGIDVVVAVIDSGIDTTQKDLKPVLWPGGASFIGPETGKEDFIAMLERRPADSAVIIADYNVHVARLQNFIGQLGISKAFLLQLLHKLPAGNPNYDALKSFIPTNEAERTLMPILLDRISLYPDLAALKYAELDHLLEQAQYHLAHGLSRDNLGDTSVNLIHIDSNIVNDPLGLVPQPNVAPDHGTHVAGIIAAAHHTCILTLKLYNNIREMRNADLASAIRYAADHGARVINMSFGKRFSLHREMVDSAVRYAMSKDVLIVHSAGNDGIDTDKDPFYPSPIYVSGDTAAAWLTVGANGYMDDSTLAPSFSNHGRRTVDVYAPGVSITSFVSNNHTATWDGTSGAAPVVAGLAALIRSYYPTLTAVQVKDIVMRSVVKRRALEDKCVSGGVVNAYNALKLAGSNPN